MKRICLKCLAWAALFAVVFVMATAILHRPEPERAQARIRRAHPVIAPAVLLERR